MSKQKNSAPENFEVIPQVSAADVRAATKDRDYGPRLDTPPILQEMTMVAEMSNPPAPPKVQRRMKPNLKILAQIDALLDKAESDSKGGARRILEYLADDRGWKIEEIGGPDDDRR